MRAALALLCLAWCLGCATSHRSARPDPPLAAPEPLPVGAGERERAALDVLQASRGGVEACWERSLRHHPQLRGQLVVRLALAEDGTVHDAAVARGTIADGELRRCVVDRLRGLRFPRFDSAWELEYPIVLR